MKADTMVLTLLYFLLIHLHLLFNLSLNSIKIVFGVLQLIFNFLGYISCKLVKVQTHQIQYLGFIDFGMSLVVLFLLGKLVHIDLIVIPLPGLEGQMVNINAH
jgi:hypothetical protein